MVIVENDMIRLVFLHKADAEGITKQIRIAGIVDMPVNIQISIDGAVFADEFLSLKFAYCSRKIHWNRKIFVFRNQFRDVTGREHPAGAKVQKEPQRTGLTDHFTPFIGENIIPGKEKNTGRRRKSMQGDFFTDGRITVHMKLAAGKNPDNVLFHQFLPTASQKRAMGARSVLHRFKNGARTPFFIQVAVA